MSSGGPSVGADTVPVVRGYGGFTKVGRGGFATVYTAYQQRLARVVAVKVLDVDLDEHNMALFAREAAITGQLDGHPNIVRVYDCGSTEAGLPYLAMEYHEAGSLGAALGQRGPFPVDQVLTIGVRLACALDYAHSQGVVHRDIKPHNVLQSRFAGPVLADFGIAAFNHIRLNTSTAEAFSVWHAAPEVLAGQPGGPLADLYSLASTLYELAAGRAPFDDPDSPSVFAVMARVKNDPVPPIGRPDVPRALDQALCRLLARDPARRPPNALVFARALQDVEAELGLPVTPLVQPGSPSAAPAGASSTPNTPSTRPVASAVPVRAPAAPVWSPGAVAGDQQATVARSRARPARGAPPAGRGPRDGGRRGETALRTVVAVLGVAIVALAVTAVWLVLQQRRPKPPTPPAPGPAPAGNDALPACPPAVDRSVLRATTGTHEAPRKLVVEPAPDGTSAVVRWVDPNGADAFAVVTVRCAAPDGSGEAPVVVVPPGDGAPVVLSGLTPDTVYCFGVATIDPDLHPLAFTGPDGKRFRCTDGAAR